MYFEYRVLFFWHKTVSKISGLFLLNEIYNSRSNNANRHYYPDAWIEKSKPSSNYCANKSNQNSNNNSHDFT